MQFPSADGLMPGMTPEEKHANNKPAYSETQLKELKKLVPDVKTDGSTREEREKTISQVELLMMKGISNVSVIAGILKIPSSTAHNYAKAVHARWEVLGSPQKHLKTKGEALSKLTLIENELWSLYSNASKESLGKKIGILAQLQSVVDRKLIINGLSPRVLEQAAQHVDMPLEGQVNPQDMMTRHQRSVKVLSKMLQLMKTGGSDATDVIDAEPC